MHVWTIEVGGVPRKWKSIDFDRSDSPDPTEFTAKIEYGSVDYFDVVEIKNGTTTEWYGFVENITPYWDKGGRYLDISGRDWTVLIWKKFTERFSDARTEGFFGAVDPLKLITFLLRCPISDVPTAANHKIGWGIDPNKVGGVWDVTASATANGHQPEWVKLRMTGLAWQLGPSYTDYCLKVNGTPAEINEWESSGGGSIGDGNYLTTYIQAGYKVLLNVEALVGDDHVHVVDASHFSIDDNTVRIYQSLGGTSETQSIDHVDIPSGIIYFISTLANGYAVGTSGVAKRVNIINAGYSIEDVGTSRGEITAARIDLYGSYIGAGWSSGTPPAEVYVYIKSGGSYISCGSVQWVDGDIGIGGLPIVPKSITLTGAALAAINTYALLNAAILKLVFTGSDATNHMARISEVRLRVTGNQWQTTNDYLKIDMGEAKTRLTGIYVESRLTANRYARNYAIETSANGTDWNSKATKSSNTARDIIESWTPIDTERYIRIRITANADYPWEITQVYVYCADDNDYCIWGTVGSKRIFTMLVGDYVDCIGSDIGKPVEYAGGPIGTLYAYDNATRKWWIEDVTVIPVYGGLVEVTGGTGKGRYASNSVVYAGGPYLSGTINSDDYLATVGTLTPINIPYQRASEALNDIVNKCHDVNYDIWAFWVSLNGDVNFKTRRGSSKPSITFVTGTNLRDVTVSGDTRGSASRARVYGMSEGKLQDDVTSDWKANADAEAILNTFFENVVSSKRVSSKVTADAIANIEVRQNGNPEIQNTLNISNDTYTPLAYDVGDDVTITDALTGLTGLYRLKTIHKGITENGEEIIFYVGTRWKDISDQWAQIRRLIREVGLGSTIIEDWSGEGQNQDKIDDTKIKDSFSKDAMNDESKPPKDEGDADWHITGVSGAQVLLANNEWFVIKGSKIADGAIHWISGYTTDADSGLHIRYDSSPKFSCDFKIPETATWYESDPTEATFWADGDYCYIRMFNDSDIGFGFKLLRENGLYALYIGANYTGGSTWIRAVVYSDGTPITIVGNTKYRLVAEVIWEDRIVKFSLGTVDGVKQIGVITIPATENGTHTMYPCHVLLETSNPAAGVFNWAWIYIYKFKSEWEWSP